MGALVGFGIVAAATTAGLRCGDTQVAADASADQAGPDVGLEGGACAVPNWKAACREGWCELPAGCFVMGSPESEPNRARYAERQRGVTLTHPLLVQQHETSVEEWLSMGFTSRNGPGGAAGVDDCIKSDCPVGRATWADAVRFAEEVSRANGLGTCFELQACHGQYREPSGPDGGEGQYWGPVCDVKQLKAETPYECQGFRLLTSAEWEYAARAGTNTAFHGGPVTSTGAIGECVVEPSLEPTSWYCANAGMPPSTHPRGTKSANAWGLHDMLGNAGELVLGSYRTEIDGGAEVDPWETQSGEVLVRGGGAYLWPTANRAASIKFMGEYYAFHAHGLRLARTLRLDEVGMRWRVPRFGAVEAGASEGGTLDAAAAD